MITALARDSVDDLHRLLRGAPDGRAIRLGVIRRGARVDVDITPVASAGSVGPAARPAAR